jgi:rhodanese-related sulfurtransferase
LNENDLKRRLIVSTPHPHTAGFLALVNDAKSRIRQTDIDGYREIAKEPHVLIDVREDNEWAAGHASGAVHMSKGTIERDIETKVPDKSATMVLYCGGGYRSALAADSLGKMGYTNVISLDGGWRAWNAAGLPVEKPWIPDRENQNSVRP